MFVECLANLPPTIGRFAPAPSAGDRAAWHCLPADVRNALVARGESLVDTAFPPLPASAYMDFRRNGDRARFEAIYLTRRRNLNAAVMAECVAHDGRFLDQVIDGIFALCEESGWQLPAHNTLVRDTPTTILPDVDTPVLDLFACETGAQLAVIDHLLGAELDTVSPLIRARIRREIDARIVTPYLSRHFWWMGHGDEPMCNWTVWCTQNVLLATMTGDYPPDLRRQVVTKAAASLDAFLKDYADDGCCEEGAQYYRHAGLCLFNAMDILNRVTDGAFATAARSDKIRNIADYIVNIHARGACYFNFADCSPLAGSAGAREYLFGLAVGSDRLADFAAADWATSTDRDLPEEINLYYRLQSAFAAERIAAHRPAAPQAQKDIHYPSVGLFVLRDATFDLAVKAGDNGDSHGHADAGSLILFKNGAPLLIDVGVETYTAKTFSAARQEIWTIRSAYHNLPLFGGVEEGYGAAYGTRDVIFEPGETESRVSMNLAGAFPSAAGVTTARRTVRFVKGEHIEIEDNRSPAGPSTLHLMLAQRPDVTRDGLMLSGLGTIAIVGGGAVRVEAIEITDPRLRQAWPATLYRVAIPFEDRILVRIGK
ncbi:MAG: heparinase [Proteobacteria bacterium]|nr:heparinase [Pseudomonadota bacterium]